MERLVRLDLYQVCLLLILLSLHGQGHSSCIENFLTATDIETIAVEENQQLEIHHEQLYIFPSLNFSCYGNITSWRVAAPSLNNGGGRPQISVWRQNEGNPQRYNQVSSQLMEREVVKELVSTDGSDVIIVKNIATTPLSFQPGDILGLTHRRQQVADFVPYLQRVDTNAGPLAYFTSTVGLDDSFTVNQNNADNLLPLVSITVSCTGVTSPDNSTECEDTSDQTSALPSPTHLPFPQSTPLLTSANPSNTPLLSNTPNPSILSSTPVLSTDDTSTELLIVIIVVLAGVVGVTIVALIVLTLLWITSSRKPGSVQRSEEMAMEINLAYGNLSQNGTTTSAIYEQIDEDSNYETMAPASIAPTSHNPEVVQTPGDDYYVNEGMGPSVVDGHSCDVNCD